MKTETFATAVRNVKEQYGLTWEDMADFGGVSYRSLTKYVHGSSVPPKVDKKWADAFFRNFVEKAPIKKSFTKSNVHGIDSLNINWNVKSYQKTLDDLADVVKAFPKMTIPAPAYIPIVTYDYKSLSSLGHQHSTWYSTYQDTSSIDDDNF